MEIEIMDEAVIIAVNPESDDYVIELSPQAFASLAKALDFAGSQPVGYVGRYCFDVDNDEE